MADLRNAANNTGIAAGDTYISIENLIGSTGDDILRGNASNNITGGARGADLLLAGAGDDVLFGGAGNDTLYGGAGRDRHYGGASADTVAYDDSVLGLRADLQNATTNTGIAAGDSYVDVERLRGSNAGDHLLGDAAGNWLFGLGGNDTLAGRDGNDILCGGAGNDTLTGGQGSDSYRFVDPSEGADRITDFEINIDRFLLDRAGFDSLSFGGLSASNFHLGSAALNGDDYVIYDGTNLYYDADANGAGAQVLVATLANGAIIDHNDFFVF